MKGTTLNMFYSVPDLAQETQLFPPDTPCKTTQMAIHPYELIILMIPEAVTQCEWNKCVMCLVHSRLIAH